MNQKLTKTYDKLEDQSRRITDSIRYAKDIQDAILPSEEHIKKTFDDVFVIYEPKDIVSGDFYWFAQVEDYAFICVADCTGHGVPGALMSMMSNVLLNEAIKSNRIFEPAKVLEFVRENIRLYIAKSKEKQATIGLSLSLCRVAKIDDSEQLEVTFSGARSSIIYWKKQEQTLNRMKSDRISIGGVRNNNIAFTQSSFVLDPADILYLFTDGYVDTANPNRQKVGTDSFLKLLKESAELPLNLQKEKLLNALHEHLQDFELRDDVTLLGVKL